NSSNAIGLPDVREDLAANKLEFVEFVYGFVPILYGDPANFLQSRRVPYTDLRGTVTHVNLFAVVGEAPPFTGIIETSQDAEVRLVVDETSLRNPGQFKNLAIEDRNAFAEKRHRHIEILQHLAGRKIDLANGRSANYARTFVQEPIVIFETLRERACIVRVAFNDTVGILRRRSQPQKAQGI